MCEGCKWYAGHCYYAARQRVCRETEVQLAKRLDVVIEGLVDRDDYGSQWPRHYDPKNVVACKIREDA